MQQGARKALDTLDRVASPCGTVYGRSGVGVHPVSVGGGGVSVGLASLGMGIRGGFNGWAGVASVKNVKSLGGPIFLLTPYRRDCIVVFVGRRWGRTTGKGADDGV